MAFFDNLDRKLSLFGQDALKKTKDMTSTVRMSSQIKDLELEQKNAFEQLGQLYFGTLTGEEELPQELSEMVSDIRKMEAEKERLRRNIQQIKGVVLCPDCAAELPMHSKFCSLCGYRIPEPEVSFDTERTCAVCGAFLEDDQLFCMECGTKVEPLAVLEEETYEECTCAVCGAPLEEEQLFCVECGTRVESAPVQEEPEEEDYEEEQPAPTVLCPECGHELPNGRKFCDRCGTRILW